MILLSTALSGFVVSLLACGVAVFLAPRLGFVDRPGAEKHKLQEHTVPYGGGVAMGLAMAGAVLVMTLLGHDDDWLMSLGHHPKDLVPILLGAAGLFVLGLVDDIRPMRARSKFLIQILIITVAIIWAGIEVTLFHHQPPLAIAAAIFWCLMLSNAYNLMDHADGLSGTLALVSVTILLTSSLMSGDTHLSALWLALGGALAGFLCWNVPPARIYMGDAGSLPLGFLIAAGCLTHSFQPVAEAVDPARHNPFAPLALLLIAALPLYDMTVVIFKRWRRDKPLFKGDRSHIAHRLGRLGLVPWASLAVVVAMQIALGGAALQLRHQDPVTAAVVLVQAAAVFLIALLLEATRDHAS